MNTQFLLLAQYNGKINIPITEIAKEYFDYSPSLAKRKAAHQQYPFPVFKVGSQKSEWLVDIVELARFLDEQKAKSKQDWEKMQLN